MMPRRRVHVIPLNDKDIHYAQMECWCHPGEIYGGVVVHNAADCREKFERQTGDGYPDKAWANIGEYVKDDQ